MADIPSPLHSKQRIEDGIHTIVSYEYLDATERLAATDFTLYDKKKCAHQLDDDSFWVLKDYSPPVWIPLGGGGGSSTDILVKTTASDDTANYLASKVSDSSSIQWAISSNPNQTIIPSVVPNSTAQQLEIAKAGTLVGTRKQLNLIEGPNITLTVTDDSGNDRVDVTVEATGGGSSTDKFVRISATDTTSGYLDSKLLVGANGLVKSTQNGGANETLTVALPTGATHNLMRFNGTAWIADTRVTDKGSAASSGNGAIEIVPTASDASVATLYSSTDSSGTNYGILGVSTIGLGSGGISNQGTGVYAETTTGSSGRAILAKALGASANNGIEIQKGSSTGAFLTMQNVSGSPATLLDFPATGTMRMWAAANYTEIKPAATITASYSMFLPPTQGSSNTYLKNDGTGNLSWAAGSSTPGGSNGQAQWNNGGVFAGTAGLIADATNVTTLTVVGTANINASGSSATNIGTSASAGTITIGNSGRTLNTLGNLTHSGAADITGSIYLNSGTSTYQTLIGNALSATRVIGELTLYGNMRFEGSAGGRLTLSTPAGMSNHTWTFPTTQGGSNTFLKNDGTGNLSWAAGTTNNPGGSDTNIQYNNSGVFAGSSNFTWNNTTPRLTVEAELYVNNNSGGRVMILGKNGSNQGGMLTIPANGASAISIQTCTTATDGQPFSVVTGAGTGNSDGGSITLRTGQEAGSGTGGAVYLYTGGSVKSGQLNLYTGGSSTGASGSILMYSGGSASGSTGAIQIYTGDSSGTAGTTGGMTIKTGNGGTTSGVGGDITIRTGQSYGSGTQSGSINLIAGNAGDSSTTFGGDITITAGNAGGTNTGGSVIIEPGGNGSGGTYGRVLIGTNTGHKLAFFNASGASKPAAYTQTYATTTRVLTKANAANDIGNLAIGAAYNQAEVQALRNQCEILASDLRILTNFVNQILDDQQAFGLL